MSNFQQNLLNGLHLCLSGNNNSIKQGEIIIQQAKAQDYRLFIINISQIISDNSLDSNIRVLSATIIGNIIKLCKSEEWLAISKNERNIIKDNLLSSLGPENFNLQKCLGLSISYIARIEFPNGEWPNLINIIESGANNNDKNNIKTSLIILKNLLHELKNKKDCLRQHLEQIFRIIFGFFDYNRLQNDQQMIQFLLETIYEILPSLDSKMKDVQFKNWFFDFIKNVLIFTETETFQAGVQLCIECCNLFYLELRNDLHNLIQCFINLANGNNLNKCTQSLIFLTELGDLEVERANYYKGQNKYLINHVNSIINLIKDILLERHNENDDLDDENSPYFVCGYLLDSLSRLDDVYIVESVFEIISNNIRGNNSYRKAAAVFAFNSIMETSAKEKIQMVLNDCLNLMSSLTIDNNQEVLINVSKCIEKSAEFHSPYILSHPEDVFQSFMNIIESQLVQRPINPKTIIHYIRALGFLAKNIIPDSIPSMNEKLYNKLSFIYNQLFDIIFIPEAYSRDINVSQAGYLTVCSLLEHSTLRDIEYAKTILNNIITTFAHTFDRNVTMNQQKRYDFQCYISSTLIALGNYGHLKLDSETGSKLYMYIDAVLKERQTLTDEAILALSSIILLSEDNKEQLVENVWGYLKYGLEQVKEESTCKYCLVALEDILGCKLESMKTHLNEVFPLIDKIISSSSNTSLLKIQIIELYSDCIGNYPMYFRDYFNKSFEYVVNAMKIFDENWLNNFDNTFVEKIKGAILVYFENTVFYAKRINQLDILKNNLQNIFNFLNAIIFNHNDTSIPNYIYSQNKNFFSNPTFSYSDAVSCGGILSELCNNLGGDVVSYINPNLINVIISILKKDSRKNLDLLNYLRHISAVLSMNEDISNI